MLHIKKIAIASIILLASSTIALAATWTEVTTSASVNTSLEVKNAPSLVSKTSDSITLEWDKVEAATTYIVKYSKTSVATSTLPNPQYDNETDPVTTTGSVIESLEPDTEYYFSVVAVDKDNNESDTYSDELKVKTDAAEAIATSTGETVSVSPTATTESTWSLALVNVVAQDNKTVSLEFSAPLSSEPVTLKITKTSDNSDIPVSSVNPDPTSPTKVLVTIATVLDPTSSYSLTIIKATDTAWNNIKQWIDGVKEFLTSDTLPNSLEAAPAITSMSWSELNASGSLDLSGSLNPANAPELPATWTKENLIVIVALILSFGIMYTYRRKTAK